MKFHNKIISLFLSLCMILVPLASSQAAMVDNSQLVSPTHRVELLQLVEQDSVRQQLSALGVTQEQVEMRIKQMTDEEIGELAQRLAELPAGGDVLGVLVLIFIVFIITDVIGATDIFPFVHPVK